MREIVLRARAERNLEAERESKLEEIQVSVYSSLTSLPPWRRIRKVYASLREVSVCRFLLTRYFVNAQRSLRNRVARQLTRGENQSERSFLLASPSALRDLAGFRERIERSRGKSRIDTLPVPANRHQSARACEGLIRAFNASV
jgi:hypothetical protein